MATPTKKSKATTATPPPNNLHRPATLDHLRKRGRPVEYVQVQLDAEAASELDKIQAEIGQLEIVNAPVYPSLLERKADAQSRVDDTTVTIKLESIGRKRYDALVEQHPPTAEQNEEHRREQTKQLLEAGKTEAEAEAQLSDAPYNADTFPAALIAACAVEPELTVEDVQTFYEEWNLNEFLALWMAAVRVHNTSKVGYWGKASG